jgi:CHAD domain-containing protein
VPVETEWQFDAIDVRPVEQWLAVVRSDAGPSVEAGSASTIVDTYLDTDDWRLYRAGYSLRIRRKGGAFEATLKSLAEGQDGLRRRTEFSEALRGRDAAALLNASGPVSTRAKLAAGKRPLEPLFDVRTRRRQYRLTLDGTSAGEIAVDRTTIPLGDGSESARLRRVEVEVPEPMVPTLAPFVESLRSASGLHPATLSKYQAGLLAWGLQPAAAPDLGSHAIDPSQSVGEVAFAVLRRHLAVLLAHEPGTRIGDDVEDLHDMRVATRRLRAALTTFGDVLPARLARFHDELGWVAVALGSVRDLDVQLEQLDAWAAESADEDAIALAPLRRILEKQQLDARERMVAVLDSRRYDRLITAFTAALLRGPLRTSKASRQPVLGAAPDLILERHRKVQTAGRRIDGTAPPAAYHRLRIRAKRLRYALEFLSEVYPQEIPALVKRLVAVQDILGLLQDADVAMRRLRSTVAEQGGSLAPPTIFAMGVVTRRYGEQEEKLRTRFPYAYAHLAGKQWKTLRREMNRRRPPTPRSPVLRSVEPLAAGVAVAAGEHVASPRGTG